MSLFDTTRDLYHSPSGLSGRVMRFSRTHRAAIESLAATSPRIGELAETFPGLLFALATGYGGAERRQEALRLIHAGAVLRDVADRVGVPWWLRRLPPEAFQFSLVGLPVGAAFSLRIGNLVPSEPDEAPAWLARTLFAYRTVGEGYALWIARQKRFPSGVAGEITETLLAAWAWHSLHPDTPAYPLLRTQWSDGVSLRRALEEAKAWSMRIDLAVALGTGIEDTWFPSGICGAHEFVALARLEQFLSEAQAMNNCLDQFADHVRQGRTRVFSIRKSGRIVADIEIGPHDDDCCVPRIVQLRGPRNRRVGPEIWQAALTWLAAQEFRPLPRVNETADRHRRQQLIRAIWRPLMDSLKGASGEKRVQALAFGKEVSRSFRAFQAAPTREVAAGSGDLGGHDSLLQPNDRWSDAAD